MLENYIFYISATYEFSHSLESGNPGAENSGKELGPRFRGDERNEEAIQAQLVPASVQRAPLLYRASLGVTRLRNQSAMTSAICRLFFSSIMK